jgi:hypothetical protein
VAKKSSPTTKTSDSITKFSGSGKKPTVPVKRNSQLSAGLIFGYAIAAIVVVAGVVGLLVYKLNSGGPEVAQVQSPANEDSRWSRDEDAQPRPADDASDSPANQAPSLINQNDTSTNLTETPQPTQNTDLAERPPVADAVNGEAMSTETGELPPVKTTTASQPPLPTSPPQADGAGEPESSTTQKLQPDQLDRFEAMLGEPVRFEGVPVSANDSKSGKTLYLRFSQDWNDTIMVFMLTGDVGDDLTLAELGKFVGKTVRIDGIVERQFGTNRLGVRIKAKDQIGIVE